MLPYNGAVPKFTPTNSGSAKTYTVSSGTFLDINISAVQICPNKPVCNTSC